MLFDIAAEATTIEEFADEVRRFFEATNEPTLLEWSQALEEVRRGKLATDLPQANADVPPSIGVVRIEIPSPETNEFDEIAEAA